MMRPPYLSVATLGLFLGLPNCAAAQPIVNTAPTVLDRRIDLDLQGAHLQDLVARLREQYGLDVRLDLPALQEAGIEVAKDKALEHHARRLEEVSGILRKLLAELEMRLAPNHELLDRLRSLPYPGVRFQVRGTPLLDALYHALAIIAAGNDRARQLGAEGSFRSHSAQPTHNSAKDSSASADLSDSPAARDPEAGQSGKRPSWQRIGRTGRNNYWRRHGWFWWRGCVAAGKAVVSIPIVRILTFNRPEICRLDAIVGLDCRDGKPLWVWLRNST